MTNEPETPPPENEAETGEENFRVPHIPFDPWYEDNHGGYPNTRQALHTLQKLDQFMPENLKLHEIEDFLQRTLEIDRNNALMLFCQSRVLDSLFYRLIGKAIDGKDEKGNQIPDYVEKSFINMALRMQKQANAATQTINTLKWRDMQNGWKEGQAFWAREREREREKILKQKRDDKFFNSLGER